MKICVYCSSHEGLDQHYQDITRKFGELIGQKGHDIIYGGASCGLMGIVARAAQKSGAHVTGIYPDYFSHLAEPVIDETIITNDLRDRKALMESISDVLVALPGGIGTLDEIFDTLAPKTLSKHQKPIIILNHNGFYDPIVDLLDKLIQEGFVAESCRDLYYFADSPEEIFRHIEEDF